MRNSSKLLAGAAVLAAIVAAGYFVYWIGTRETQGSPIRPAAEVVTVTPEHAVPPESRPILHPRTNIYQPPLPIPAVVTNPPQIIPPIVAVAPTNNPGLITNWEDKVDDILGTEGDDTNKVHQLLAMFPHLPQDGQTEVAQHLSNLVSDEDYKEIMPFLLNTNLPEPVLDAFFNDLLNRPNSSKLPLLLDIARSPSHPEAGDAKDLLELYLDEDYGNDWATWQQKLQAWLRENPN